MKTILRKQQLSNNFFDSCVKSFLNNLYIPKVVAQNVPERNVFVKLPFLGKTLLEILKKL